MPRRSVELAPAQEDVEQQTLDQDDIEVGDKKISQVDMDALLAAEEQKKEQEMATAREQLGQAFRQDVAKSDKGVAPTQAVQEETLEPKESFGHRAGRVALGVGRVAAEVAVTPLRLIIGGVGLVRRLFGKKDEGESPLAGWTRQNDRRSNIDRQVDAYNGSFRAHARFKKNQSK